MLVVDSPTGLADPLVGRLVDGRYAVEALLARGGMATVYRARDTRLDRDVALKVIAAGSAADPMFVGRVEREAKAAARLSHPHLVAVYDQGTDPAGPYLAMELVEGRTLRQLLRERGRLSPAQALSVMRPVVAGLAAVHAAGLVHRDLKPENVLLGDDGRVKLADLGLAHAADGPAGTVTSDLPLGTAAYMAPEQLQHGGGDARSDVYAAGCVLHELLTGEPPFSGPTAVAIAYRHVHEDAPAPSARVAGVPPALDDLVVAATRRDPSRRPQDARALLAALDAVAPVVGEEVAPAADLAATQVIALPRDDQRTQVVPVMPDAGQRTQVVPVVPPADPPPAVARRRDRRRWFAVLALLVAAAAVGAAAVLGWWLAVGRDTAVPRVVGDTLAVAQARLAHAGFTVREGAPVHSLSVPAGDVAAQDPAGGHRARRHAVVTLQLSSGPELHAVPDLSGVELPSARTRLAAARLTLGSVTERYDDALPAGTVLATRPVAGTALPPGSAVDVVLSRGPAPVSVPSLVGRSRDDAESALKDLGLTADVQEAFSDTVPAGTVSAQSPRPGKVLRRGQRVRLVVSKGPDLVAVPDVRGDSVADATRRLQAAGFHVTVQRIPGGFSDRVISEDPGPGSRQRRGSNVTVYSF